LLLYLSKMPLITFRTFEAVRLILPTMRVDSGIVPPYNEQGTTNGERGMPPHEFVVCDVERIRPD